MGGQTVRHIDKVVENYRDGWLPTLEWKCPNCGIVIDRGPLNEKPYHLARQHSLQCIKKES